MVYARSMRYALNRFFSHYITAYRIEDGVIPSPPATMKKKDANYVRVIMSAIDKEIGKENNGFIVEQMSNVLLTPIPTGGYEVEYTARFGSRLAAKPTKVTITQNYTGYDELLELLKRLSGQPKEC